MVGSFGLRFHIINGPWKNIPQKNPVILSRFSVEMAWDFCYRINLSADLTYHWPTRWWSKYGYANGKKQLFQSWLPKTIDYHPPLPLSKKQLDSLIDNTNQYGDEEVQQVNLVDAFCGLQPTYLWSFDAIRPPVQAIRTAAELIEQELVGDLSNPLREFSRTHLNVLALELGHSAASQALSVFLPGFTITTSSLVYQGTQYSHRPEKFDAVVMNIPNAAAMVFTRFILDRHRSEPVWPLHHHELHRFWEWPTNDPGCHLPFLMTIAMTKLADDGLLVIMGDIESGQLHRAADIVRQDNSLVPLRIAGNDRPIQFQYKSKPWGLYDSIRPTGRLIDAWRRKP